MTSKKIDKSKWKTIFGMSYKDIYFDLYRSCSYNIIISIKLCFLNCIQITKHISLLVEKNKSCTKIPPRLCIINPSIIRHFSNKILSQFVRDHHNIFFSSYIYYIKNVFDNNKFFINDKIRLKCCIWYRLKKYVMFLLGDRLF